MIDAQRLASNLDDLARLFSGSELTVVRTNEYHFLTFAVGRATAQVAYHLPSNTFTISSTLPPVQRR